jgi:hypothetical protein
MNCYVFHGKDLTCISTSSEAKAAIITIFVPLVCSFKFKQNSKKETAEEPYKRASLVQHPQRQNIKMPEVSLCAKNTTKTSQLQKVVSGDESQPELEGVLAHTHTKLHISPRARERLI